MRRPRVPASAVALAVLLLHSCSACPTEKRFLNETEVNPATGMPFPLTLLFSFEGSGNTWTRALLENATGM